VEWAGIALPFLELTNRWRKFVTFTLRPPFHRELASLFTIRGLLVQGVVLKFAVKKKVKLLIAIKCFIIAV
jgi:hypothetical protein